MSNRLNDNLILAIKQHIPPGNTLVYTLMDILSLGKESIYRRLRSEVPFTFDEVVKISIQFGISLDKLIDAGSSLNQTKWVVMDMDKLYTPSGYFEQDSDKMKMLIEVFQHMQQAKTAKMCCATNHLPFFFTMPFESLYRFNFYKWIYLMQGVQPDFYFSKITIPAHVREIEKRFMAEYQLIPRTIFILNKNVFLIILTDILHFYRHGLISETEIRQFKKDFLSLIAYLEQITANGTNESGKEISIYLSDVNIDMTYIYLEYGHHSFSVHRPYFIDSLYFYNEKICQKQKEWIESLKRYSTPISQSGEMQRFEYFTQQKQLIEKMLSVN